MNTFITPKFAPVKVMTKIPEVEKTFLVILVDNTKHAVTATSKAAAYAQAVSEYPPNQRPLMQKCHRVA